MQGMGQPSPKKCFWGYWWSPKKISALHKHCWLAKKNIQISLLWKKLQKIMIFGIWKAISCPWRLRTTCISELTRFSNHWMRLLHFWKKKKSQIGSFWYLKGSKNVFLAIPKMEKNTFTLLTRSDLDKIWTEAF